MTADLIMDSTIDPNWPTKGRGGESSMPTTQKTKMIVETRTQRDRALQLLEALRRAKERSEENLTRLNQTDFLKKVTGASSMDNAIASTQRLIDAFNRVLSQLHNDLDEADLALLGTLEQPAPPVA
jgi:hypothetical protein